MLQLDYHQCFACSFDCTCTFGVEQDSEGVEKESKKAEARRSEGVEQESKGAEARGWRKEAWHEKTR